MTSQKKDVSFLFRYKTSRKREVGKLSNGNQALQWMKLSYLRSAVTVFCRTEGLDRSVVRILGSFNLAVDSSGYSA